MKLIIGLGNPGEKYIFTRHNLGFMALDEYVKKHSGPKYEWKLEKKFKSEVFKLGELLLVKPQTHMNASGVAAGLLKSFFKIKVEDIIVIHDDLDLPLGKIRLRVGGSGGGHHGVEDIIFTLGEDNFTRIRLGIGNIKSKSGEHNQISFEAEKFVVDNFISSEKSKVKQMLKKTTEALDLILEKGIEVAQNQLNQ
ncbi:MAG: aminoacyl-tRNA hydrolase [Candidatus Daviesbacteria bacterium]|nr:aminoacyl-tRNA hydrolase [Candidatus Daviesbacteria bacterium]